MELVCIVVYHDVADHPKSRNEKDSIRLAI